jgi:ubiquinone/menaquinone biosynthesis C-methylase UbiE
MDDEVRFAADLYRGTAGYYDRYRLPYPEAMIEDLARTARVSGCGRLLDLACGTGQLTFPLRQRFADVWAVDQEPDMMEMVRVKAAAAGARNVRPIVASAETLHAAAGHFELAVIGNAFHRLDRDVTARRLHGWLQPGGHLALCSSPTPWLGEARWQLALAATLDKWKAAQARFPGTVRRRIPAGRTSPVRDRAPVDAARGGRVHPVHIVPSGRGTW